MISLCARVDVESLSVAKIADISPDTIRSAVEGSTRQIGTASRIGGTSLPVGSGSLGTHVGTEASGVASMDDVFMPTSSPTRGHVGRFQAGWNLTIFAGRNSASIQTISSQLLTTRMSGVVTRENETVTRRTANTAIRSRETMCASRVAGEGVGHVVAKGFGVTRKENDARSDAGVTSPFGSRDARARITRVSLAPAVLA